MIAIAYHADLKEVQAEPRLARLLSDAGATAPFDRLAWWQGLVEHCGVSPLIAVADDGTDILVLALQHAGGRLSALSKWYSFWVRPRCTSPAAAPALMRALARDLARSAHRITLSGLPDEDGSAALVEQAFAEAGWQITREASDTNHYLDLAGRDFDTYLATRPGPLRTTLKRKQGKVECRILTAFDPRAWADYEAIYRESWKPEEGSFAFLRQFAEAEAKAGRMRLGLADAGGEAVAAQLWTVEGGTAFIHKLAHREAAKPLSPGTSLSAALFRHVIDNDRVSHIDFGTGDNPYKRDWMESVRPRWQVDMIRPADPRNWPLLARRSVRRLAATAARG